MKKIIALFFVFSLIISFTSCSTDDEEVSSNSGDLVGKWEIHTILEYDNNEIVEEDHYEPGERIWEFKTDGYVHINEEGGMNRDVEYQFKPEKDEIVVMGILLRIEKLNSHELHVRDGVHEMQYRKL
jgi:hypothetical protein